MPVALYGSASSFSGSPRAFLWARLGPYSPQAESCISYEDLYYFSAARVLSWLSWPPSGCLGPVPLALRGRSEGPASLAHGNAFSVFLINDAFFPRPSFFKLPRGSKGGPGTTLEYFYDHQRLQMDPSRTPFRSQTPPETT